MFFQFPKDNSAEFIFEYDNPDPDFGTIDYSGIECECNLYLTLQYFIDGVSYVTDASGIVHFIVNDMEEHVFSCVFGGQLFEFTFDASTQQYITLPTKSISSIVLYDKVFKAADEVSVDLYFYDGTQWILIGTALTDAEGLVSFTGLIMGSYIAVESGFFVEENIFTLEQAVDIYTTGVLIPPKETIIDIDYLKEDVKILKIIKNNVENKYSLYTLYESANYIDKEEKFDKFRDGLSSILHYIVELWDKNHQNLNIFNSTTILNEFFIQISYRLQKYIMYRLYRIMTIYQADNVVMTPNLMSMFEDRIKKPDSMNEMV